MKTIELVVSPKGESTLETKGFAGDSCKAASSFLEAALGVKLSERPTAEAFVSAVDRVVHQSH